MLFVVQEDKQKNAKNKAHSRLLGMPNNMLCAFCCLIRHITAVYIHLGKLSRKDKNEQIRVILFVIEGVIKITLAPMENLPIYARVIFVILFFDRYRCNRLHSQLRTILKV